jgi:hypothetical protein
MSRINNEVNLFFPVIKIFRGFEVYGNLPPLFQMFRRAFGIFDAILFRNEFSTVVFQMPFTEQPAPQKRGLLSKVLRSF